MSINGLDTATTCTSTTAIAMKNDGYNFVGRYYGNYALSYAEAQDISNAGLYIVALFENGSPTNASYFSYDKGYNDATLAYLNAKNEIGQPSSTPIYFAVDYDATSSDISGVILQYFNGVIAALLDYGGDYSAGVYGSGSVCSYIYNNTSIAYTMLAQSTGWSGYNSWTTWNIKQRYGVNVNGISCDSDVANDGFGGFQIS
jgi:hypothetical protein